MSTLKKNYDLTNEILNTKSITNSKINKLDTLISKNSKFQKKNIIIEIEEDSTTENTNDNEEIIIDSPKDKENTTYELSPYPFEEKEKSNYEKTKKNNIIIFDWDDTLLCTTVLSPNGYFDDHLKFSKEGKEKIEKLEKKVKEILELSISKGITYIITNSEPGWVKYSCCRFLPEVLPILKRVKIISSRSLYQNIYPNDSKMWKIKTFNLVYKSCNRSLPSNIICIGDCNGDIQAGKNLANKFNECSLKTIKFIDSPTIDELSNQICLVYNNFDCIFSAQNNWDIVVQKRINGKI